MTSKHSQAPILISQGVFDSMKTFDQFEQKVSGLFATNTKAQGDAFEIFVEAYLATQPILQCQEVWLVGDIPVDIREDLNLPNDSKGIDGVYRSMMGTSVPYQVKFRSNRPALGFNEVAPFLGITEKATDRLLITNCDTIAIDVKNRTGIRSLRGVDFDQLTEEDFTVIENWLKQKPAKRKPITPDPYQIEALTDISNHLAVNDRGSVVMACGTGKTLVALWAVEQSKAKSILVLVPSLTLLQQTLEEWSIHNSWARDFSYLCVCSDPSVNLKNDEIEIDPTDVPFRIDTDPEIVRSYLAQDNGKTKIVFSTYQSSQVVSQATKGEFEFDIGIFDEAHKTTGSATGRFALALKDENIQIKKRLFLTATPKHYDISKRDKDGEFKFVSMDDESVYGKRAHTLTFGDAASKGIICPYKVVITLIDKQQVDDFALKNGITLVDGDMVQAKWVASQIAVSSAIKHTNATKIITFHSRVKTAREFASDEVYGVKKFVKNFEVFHVHGKQKSNERKDTISKFRKAPRSLITNAKCLTEGVDVPAVDMVAFVDPRHSKIDIAQAVGRAMRKPRGGDKKVGYIVVPIFAEDTSEVSLEKAIKSEDFDDVALILNSLLEQDEELVEIVRDLKQAKGRGDVFSPQRLKDKVEVIGPLIGLNDLTNSIYVEAIDRLGDSWDEWYGRLVQYVIDHGDALVLDDYKTKDGFLLGKWVGNQRYRPEFINEYRKFKLEMLKGWSWDPLEDNWNDYFQTVNDYLSLFHFSNIHVDTIFKNKNIGSWIQRQKILNNNNNLPVDKATKLSNLPNWTWDSFNDSKWMRGLEELIAYFNLYKSSRVNIKYITPNGFKLGQWVFQQRQLFKDGALIDNRILELEKLNDWTWVPHDDSWIEMLHLLKDFYSEYGNINVPRNYQVKGQNLGVWFSYQRKREVRGELEPYKLELLNKFDGWERTIPQRPMNWLRWLRENGASEQSVNYKNLSQHNKDKLSNWIKLKSNKYFSGHLSKLEADELVSIKDWNWITPNRKDWDFRFIQLKEYFSNKSLNTQNISASEESFVKSQRLLYKKNRLTSKQVNQLESIIGWTWDPQGDKWMSGFNSLVKFVEDNNAVPSMSAVSNDGFPIGRWVNKQRTQFRAGRLSKDRQIKLELISGWWWNA